MEQVQALFEKTLELSQRIRERSDTLQDSDLKLYLADLQLALADLKLHYLQALEGHQGSDSETPEFRDGMYYFNGEGPYCVNCWDNKKRRARLVPLERALTAMGKYQCPQCNSFYKG